MTEIFRQIYAGQCVGEEESRLMMDILKRQQQGGRLQLYLPEEIETAHKCGDSGRPGKRRRNHIPAGTPVHSHRSDQ